MDDLLTQSREAGANRLFRCKLFPVWPSGAVRVMINWLPLAAGMFNVRVTVTPVMMRLFSPATVRVEVVVSSPALGCPVMLAGGTANGTSVDETETADSPSSVSVQERRHTPGSAPRSGCHFHRRA